MVELLFGCFLVFALVLAFREDREHNVRIHEISYVFRAEQPKPDPFGESVYDAIPVEGEDVLVEEPYLVEEPTLVSMLSSSSDIPVLQ